MAWAKEGITIFQCIDRGGVRVKRWFYLFQWQWWDWCWNVASNWQHWREIKRCAEMQEWDTWKINVLEKMPEPLVRCALWTPAVLVRKVAAWFLVPTLLLKVSTPSGLPLEFLGWVTLFVQNNWSWLKHLKNWVLAEALQLTQKRWKDTHRGSSKQSWGCC